MRAWAVRGRRHRSRRRLWPDDGPARGDPAASRPRSGERARQPAQRQARRHADHQYRRRAFDRASSARRAADERHRNARPADVGVRAPDRQRRVDRAGCRGCLGRKLGERHRDADLAGGYGLVGAISRGSARQAFAAAAARSRSGQVQGGRRSFAQRLQGGADVVWAGFARRCACRCRKDLRQDRRAAVCAGRQRAHRARARSGADREDILRLGAGSCRIGRARHDRADRRQGAGHVLWLPNPVGSPRT